MKCYCYTLLLFIVPFIVGERVKQLRLWVPFIHLWWPDE